MRRSRGYVRFAIASCLAFALWSMPALGALDPTFDQDGKVVVDVPGGISSILASGGQIVASLDGGQMRALRISSAGVPDPTFGGETDGLLVTNIDAQAVGVALRAGGGYWLGGWSSPEHDFVLVAITSSGQVDATFGGGDGVQTLDLGGHEIAVGMEVDALGNILLVGLSGETFGGAHDMAIARFTPEGAPDDSFGVGGAVIIDVGGMWDSATSVGSTSAGQPVVAGASGANDGSSQIVVVRLEVDGDPDSTFDGDGVLTDGIGIHSAGEALKVLPNGKILVGATTWETVGDFSTFNFAIARFTSSGARDTSFGANGRRITDFGGRDEVADLEVLDDGSILVVGEAANDFGLVRYTKKGVVDPRFGKQRTHFYTDQFGNVSHDAPATMALLPDGRFLLAGTTTARLFPQTGNRVALARYKDPGAACTKIGTRGADVMSGTSGPDVLCPIEGDDVVRGHGGGDVIIGWSGDDRLYGEEGWDQLFGNAGRDVLNGGPGSDTCGGGPDPDVLVGCEG